MSEVAIVDVIRTPIGKNGGVFADVHPVDLLAFALGEIKTRNGLDAVDDIIAGCALQSADQASNIARFAGLVASFPDSVPAKTINRLCGSSQEALHSACQAILAGDAEVVIAAGVESMTRVPMDLSGKHRPASLSAEIEHQGLAAEKIAARWNLSREELDAFSIQSHERAARASREGAFDSEIAPFPENGQAINIDQGIRFQSDPAKTASLKPAFLNGGVITAANASQISDGAAAALLCSPAYARKMGWKIRARVTTRVAIGSDPVLMLTGPIAATARALDRAGLSPADIDLFEVNEAFAAVALAWQKETGVNADRLNVHGGAIALGHPLGASGVRILATLINALERGSLRRGLMTMCIGYGQATATIVESS